MGEDYLTPHLYSKKGRAEAQNRENKCLKRRRPAEERRDVESGVDFGKTIGGNYLREVEMRLLEGVSPRTEGGVADSLRGGVQKGKRVVAHEVGPKPLTPKDSR